ncbi:hypothetical protein [Mycolicibacterium sediminis]|uniref:Integral membrane protein n=1 Tax=Mycolicibacterium sediminis TaxID=1286180 RepID=A0A7I7QKA1_9MYCO|nr:hypothetical protein [Mycolicibacterium sediminis]BBY26682.1 hypothetical protein MSEDJ_07780 [Mycolicibacterium sediminis]
MRALSPAFGLLMIAAIAGGVDGPAFGLVAAAVVAVAVGVRWAVGATVAVVCVVALVVLTDPPALVAALAGLAATAYLVTRHVAEASVSAPTMLGALALSSVATFAAVVPADVAWLPAAAPFAAVVVFAVVARPFLPPD